MDLSYLIFRTTRPFSECGYSSVLDTWMYVFLQISPICFKFYCLSSHTQTRLIDGCSLEPCSATPSVASSGICHRYKVNSIFIPNISPRKLINTANAQKQSQLHDSLASPWDSISYLYNLQEQKSILMQCWLVTPADRYMCHLENWNIHRVRGAICRRSSSDLRHRRLGHVCRWTQRCRGFREVWILNRWMPWNL